MLVLKCTGYNHNVSRLCIVDKCVSIWNSQDHEESEFEVHEVYAIDCLISSGEGHPKDMDTRTTIYKRNPDIVYQLKMKASRGLWVKVPLFGLTFLCSSS